MKKTFILSLLALGLTACETMNRVPYSGDLGNYGFTYDLDGTPSPFIDNSYIPLTASDLAAPIIVVVTNQPSAKVIHQTAPEIGVTTYAGVTPSQVVIVSPGQISEPSGADRGTSAAGGGGAPGSGGGNFNALGVSVFVPSGSLPNSNNVPTNYIPTNGIPTNSIPTNDIPTNQPPFPTNAVPTNAFPG